MEWPHSPVDISKATSGHILHHVIPMVPHEAGLRSGFPPIVYSRMALKLG